MNNHFMATKPRLWPFFLIVFLALGALVTTHAAGEQRELAAVELPR